LHTEKISRKGAKKKYAKMQRKKLALFASFAAFGEIKRVSYS